MLGLELVPCLCPVYLLTDAVNIVLCESCFVLIFLPSSPVHRHTLHLYDHLPKLQKWLSAIVFLKGSWKHFKSFIIRRKEKSDIPRNFSCDSMSHFTHTFVPLTGTVFWVLLWSLSRNARISLACRKWTINCQSFCESAKKCSTFEINNIPTFWVDYCALECTLLCGFVFFSPLTFLTPHTGMYFPMIFLNSNRKGSSTSYMNWLLKFINIKWIIIWSLNG